MNINASNVLGGKTARACDSCLLKRARWFCAADDAFLCQSCDAAVHSANQLASRHERVRLETSSCKLPTAPSWHQGFTKKARTPRHAKPWSRPAPNHQLPVVPEMSSDDPFQEETDEQLFCRVPVLEEQLGFGSSVFDDDHELNLEELLSSCDDEFAADVESLLGNGIDGLTMRDEKRVKVEDDDAMACHFDPAMELINWELDFPSEEGGEEEMRVTVKKDIEMESSESRKLLRLNYEAVMAAWDSQGSPWTDGVRPQFNLDEFMGAWLDEWGKGGRRDAGREARVCRYREKRRRRLFSKKIRYEVRKLNAEKRPRMKGRFVKRTTHSFL
ncbi:zinc finger protein CONSTANS-LIKE 16 [Salvia miltiorrhiza]|uniref:zinc finger protein CONSTANS-LIKE 16 n=1 Tax=Salvia miltiorrhiza TaxID=226208 RepID=UPI0025AD396F|nr:zinc finger protein CONSTANS-LIKE 16 [Salvia miltiorrhiza]